MKNQPAGAFHVETCFRESEHLNVVSKSYLSPPVVLPVQEHSPPVVNLPFLNVNASMLVHQHTLPAMFLEHFLHTNFFRRRYRDIASIADATPLPDVS